MSESPWITAKEAAAHAKCGLKAIYSAVASQQVRVARIGGRRALRFRAEWIDEWLDSTTTPVITQPKKWPSNY